MYIPEETCEFTGSHLFFCIKQKKFPAIMEGSTLFFHVTISLCGNGSLVCDALLFSSTVTHCYGVCVLFFFSLDNFTCLCVQLLSGKYGLFLMVYFVVVTACVQSIKKMCH